MAVETVAKAAPQVRETTRGVFLRQTRKIFGRDWHVAWLFMLPTALLLIGLIGYPLVEAVRLSFYNVTGNRNTGYVGLLQYERLWNDHAFRESVKNTVEFALLSVFFKFWIGLIAANILNRASLKFASFFTGLVLLPWIIPEVVTAFTWRGLYEPRDGGLNILLKSLGVIEKDIGFLSDPDLALFSVIAVNVWKGIPFFTVLFLAGLKAIDRELYDAASVDGASGWNRFRDITLPGLRYVIIVAVLLSFIWTLNSFGIIYLMTRGGPLGATQLYSILSFEYAITKLQFSKGVAVAMSIVPALLVLIVLLGKVMQSDSDRPNENPGLISRIFSMIGWPFARIAEFSVFLIGLAAWPFGFVAEKIGTFAHDAYVRGDSDREGGYRRLTRRLSDVFAYVVLALLLFFLLFPFYWVIATAFKTQEQIRTRDSPFVPTPWTLENFRYMLSETEFPRWFWNTVQVAAVSTGASVIIAALGAYALVRLRWRGARVMSTIILFTYLMPTVMLFIPLYRIFTEIKIINTLGALMVAYPTFGLPFACWLLMGYYRSIPKELEEAAFIDGAGYLQVFVRIVLPLTLPALLAVALFAITSAWNEFLLAFTMIFSENSRTLPVGMSNMIVADIFPYGELFAASIMTAIPVAIMYMVAQRFMVGGLVAGSVKG